MITTHDEKILRNRILECICNRISSGRRTFYGVDMVKECARAFLDEKGIEQYQFSGEHEYYRHVLNDIYRPLVELGLLDEYENNQFKIPEDSKLGEICDEQMKGGKEFVEWDNIRWQDYKKHTT